MPLTPVELYRAERHPAPSPASFHSGVYGGDKSQPCARLGGIQIPLCPSGWDSAHGASPELYSPCPCCHRGGWGDKQSRSGLSCHFPAPVQCLCVQSVQAHTLWPCQGLLALEKELFLSWLGSWLLLFVSCTSPALVRVGLKQLGGER